MTRFRRSVIWGAGITAVLTLAAGAVAGWRLVEEEMCIRRLDSEDEGERDAAAERLGRMKSSRAVDKLVPLALSGSGPAKDALVEIGEASVPPLLEEVHGSHSPAEAAATWLLDKFGPEATRAFLAGARHDRKEVRMLCVSALVRCLEDGPDVHAGLVKALEDPEWEVRCAAVYPLVRTEVRETEVVRLLSGRLLDTSEEPTVRYEAASWMAALRAPGRTSLEGAMKHADPLVRVYAADSLLDRWPDLEQETVPVLLDGLRAPDWRARSGALDCLSGLDRSSPPRRLTASILKTLLEDPVGEVRSAAVRVLERYEPTEEMVAPLIAILQAESGALDDAVARVAANALGRLGPRAGAAIPALIDCVEKTPHSYMREQAVWALGRMGPAAAPAVPALAAALKNGCCPAIDALGSIGEAAREATPVIVEALSSPDCAGEAHPALVRLGPGIIPDLLPALRSGEAAVRVRIMEVLAEFGPSAEVASAELAAFLKEEAEWEVKVEAVRTLGRVGRAAASHADLLLRILSGSLEEPGTLSAVAAEALGRIGIPEGSSAAPLIEAARSEDHEVRAHALLALGRLRRGDSETIALLRRGLADTEPVVRSFSAMGLRDLGIDDGSVAKALPAVFAASAASPLVHALEGFPGETKRVLPWLVDGLSGSGADYTAGVIERIEELGPEAKSALPRLLELVAKAREGTDMGDLSLFIDDIEELCRRLEGGPG